MYSGRWSWPCGRSAGAVQWEHCWRRVERGPTKGTSKRHWWLGWKVDLAENELWPVTFQHIKRMATPKDWYTAFKGLWHKILLTAIDSMEEISGTIKCCGPRLWNSLPHSLRSFETYPTFCSHLKNTSFPRTKPQLTTLTPLVHICDFVRVIN